ncbi:uncharacterized protein LOC119719611 [Patiria miniata]|nr:uncharacterized protein LOC119719611 [Patiria miniata]
MRQASLDLAERAQCTISPTVEGRIFHLTQEERHHLTDRQSQFILDYKEELEIQLTDNNNTPLHYAAKSYPHTLTTPIPEVVVSSDMFSGSHGNEDDDDDIASPSSSFVAIYDDDEMRCMWTAVQQDDVTEVQRLHQEQYVNLSFMYEQTSALHVAAEHDALRVAEYLLQEAKMDPDVRDAKCKNTPLMVAAIKGNLEMAELLIHNSASLDTVNQEGKCPKECLPESCSSQLMSLLTVQGNVEDNQTTRKNGAML